MKQKGRMVRVPTGGVRTFYTRPCFDGRYVWVGRFRKEEVAPSLLVLDPQSGRTDIITPRDGLPFPTEEKQDGFRDRKFIAVAELAPGRVCVAGSSGRAWVALVSFDPKKGPTVEVVHRAPDLLEPGDPRPDRWKSTFVAFGPGRMITLGADPSGKVKTQQRVLIERGPPRGEKEYHRGVEAHPLVFDPATKKVDVLSDPISHAEIERAAVHEGALYWVSTGPETDRSRRPGSVKPDLWTLGLPDLRRTRLARGLDTGKAWYPAVGFDKDRIVLGFGGLAAAGPDWKFQPVQGTVPGVEDLDQFQFFHSAHYGLVLDARNDQIVAIRLSDRPTEAEPDKTPLAQRKPAPPPPHILMIEPSGQFGWQGLPIASRAFLVPARKGGKGQPTVVLDQTAEPPLNEAGTLRLLVREIVRQGFLIAARDGLGMATRDETLGDVPPTPPGKPAIELLQCFRDNNGGRILLRRADRPDAPALVDERLDVRATPGFDYPKLVERVEVLSRGPFVTALRGAGWVGAPNKSSRDAPVPKGTEERLAVPTFTTQFAALRDLHDAIRTDGESPQRLGALVRAYAQLGVLTESHWTAAHQAFHARALLYAQRLVARDPQSPWGFWHRGFAEALAGLHAAALNDLAKADQAWKARGGGKSATARPAWVDLIDAYCRFDLSKLRAQPDGREKALAALLNLLAVEFTRSTNVLYDAGQAVLEANAECFRAYDALCESQGISILHSVTVLGPQVLTETLAGRCQEMPGFPAAALAELAQGNESRGLDRLDEAGAPGDGAGEPSWSLLANLVREVRFAQAYRRAHFMRDMWAVPTDDYLAQARPLVARHPYRGFIESFAHDPRREQAAILELIQDIRVQDPEDTESPLLTLLDHLVEGLDEAGQAMVRHRDDVARDLERLVSRPVPAGGRPDQALRLLGISPHNPFAMAGLMKLEWSRVQPHLAAWEKDQGGNPDFLAAMAESALARNRPQDAQRHLEQYLRAAPDRWAYMVLAKLYKDRKDMAGWRKTLDEYLTKPDFGLGHMAVQVEIAQFLMDQKKWKEAMPYARDAAETWAGMGMIAAFQCYEALGDWENAELWVRRLSERYPDPTWLEWFLWCKKTGHGDVQAAEKFAAEYAAALAANPRTLDDVSALGSFYLVTGQPKPALQAYTLLSDQNQSSNFGLIAALLADELRQYQVRDQILKRITQFPRTSTLTNKYCTFLRGWLSQGDAARFDPAAHDALLKTFPAPGQALLNYITGRFLENHGHAKEARTYFERAARNEEALAWVRPIILSAARERGLIGPMKARADETKGADAKKGN